MIRFATVSLVADEKRVLRLRNTIRFTNRIAALRMTEREALRMTGRVALRMTEPTILWAGFGDFGQDFLFFFFFGRAAEVVFGEAVAKESEGIFWSVDEFKKM